MVYLGILFLVNRIPHVKIRSLGFFSVRGIVIESPAKIIRIRLIRLRINLLRGKDSPLKLFNLEIYDPEIKILEKRVLEDPMEDPEKSTREESSDTGASTDSGSSTGTNGSIGTDSGASTDPTSIDIEKLLKLVVPKKVYEMIFYYRLLNQIHILVFRCSIYNENVDKDTALYFDYAKLENFFCHDSHNSLTLLLFNGYLHGIQDTERIHIFRNIEIILSCSVIFSCGIVPNQAFQAQIGDFALNVSLGKTHIPLDHFHIRKSKPKPSAPKPYHPVSKNTIRLLRQVWNHFSDAKVTLEDFTISKGPWSLRLATFQTSLVHNKKLEDSVKSVADFSLHITSMRLFESETKCFELPAGACACEFNPFGLLEGIENTHLKEMIKQVNSSLDFKLNITLTGPAFDIYHDQIIKVKSQSLRRAKKPTKTHANIMNLFYCLEYVSTKMIIVDSKITIHVPPFGQLEFHRESELNLTTFYTIDAIVQRFATKNLSKALSPEHLEGSKSRDLYGLFKVKNFKANLLDNLIYLSKCNVLVTYDVTNELVSLKVNTKKIKVKSMNSAIFQLVREIQTRKILLQNKIYSELRADPNNNVSFCDAPESATVLAGEYWELFKILPEFVNHVKVEIHDFQTDIICKDGLPLQIYYDEETNQQFDLKDYGRGVSIKFAHTGINYKKDKEEVIAGFRSIQCFTLSELDLDYMEDFDVVSLYTNNQPDLSDVTSLESIALAEREEEDLRQVKKVFNIDEIEITNTNNRQRDKNRLSVRIPEINGRVDIFLVWCSIYATTLIKMFAPTVERSCSKKEMHSLMGKQEKKLKMDILVLIITLVVRLPNTVDVLTEFDSLHIRDVFKSHSIEFKWFRSYVVHPKTKLWSRFLTLKDSFVAMNSKVEDAQALDVICRGIRLNIPHGFLFYTVIDNIVTFGKAIKQITQNFSNLNKGIMDFQGIAPEAREAFQVPTVNIKSKIFGITLENDPFENELSYILELGYVEQRMRLRKQRLFDQRATEILNNTVESKAGLLEGPGLGPPLLEVNSGQRKPNHATKLFHPLRHVDSANEVNEKNASTKGMNGDGMNGHHSLDDALLSEEDAHKQVEDARYKFESELSTSWIHKFKKFRAIKIKNWRERSERAWGAEEFNEAFTKNFDIMNYLDGPLLMGGFFRDLDLTVSKADIPDLDVFLRDLGKGQPKLEYSILVPLYLSIKSAGLFIFLKDYALPLVSFPENDDVTKPSFQLSGNVVVNEKLVTRVEEMRRIWVPFSPPMAPEQNHDTFYSVLVPRTLTPVKFMVDLDCTIDSERPAIISWCKAYQAGLLAAMSAVDNFTKPQIDDSPIGWWDKMSLLLHGRTTFNIPNELCFHMKSSMNPYDLTGRSAGFVFCWKNNVSLKINPNEEWKDLITLDSDDFLLAVPNYSVAEKRSWSLFYDELNVPGAETESDTKKYLKKVMQLASDERVQWRLGLLFERNKHETTNLSDKEERVDKFIPHYDVVVTGPDHEWHPDSYKGFRSDYIHLAISVKSVSKSGNAFNNVHLSPLAFQYFFYWWDTITEAISLPIRQGRLFDSAIDHSHVKMGTHLFTVKYQLIFEPLNICHMYMHSAGEKDNKVTFTGLKGRSSKCVIDLHQRKEVLTYINRKLNIENQILHLKMNQAEVSFDETDIRLVNAVFADKSVQSHLAKYLAGSITDSSSGETGDNGNYLKWIDNLDVEGGDLSWINQEDFTELEVREILSPYPKITIIPFCFSPRFSYVREFSLQEEGPFPFGSEDAHDCELGAEKPEDTQGKLIANRLDTLKDEIGANEELLNLLKQAAGDESINKTELARVSKTIEDTKDKQYLLETLYEEITGRIAPGEVSYEDTGSSNITRLNSRLLSVYSGHKSYEEARKARLLNKEASEFHNRFIVHNLQLKWDNRLKDMFMTYTQLVSDRKSEIYFMSKKAVDLVETVINSVPEEIKLPNIEDEFCTECKAGEEIINDFDDYLDDVDNENEEAEHKFLVKLVHPQIQLMSQKDPDSAAVITSKDVELRIMSVNVKGVNKLINADNDVSGIIESRYGSLFTDSSIFVFRKDQTVITHPNIPYGYVDGQLAVDWPPWVEPEHVYENSWMENEVITEKNCMGVTYRKPNYLYVDSSAKSQKNEIKVHLAKFVFNADSRQYSTLFYIITDLLVSGKSQKNSLMNKLDKVISLAGSDDFVGLDERVKALQASIREFHELLLRLDSKSLKLTEHEKFETSRLELELEKRKLELSMIMRSFKLRNMKSNNKRATKSWLIAIDQIIWHFLDANRQPFVDLAIAGTSFKRVDSMDGSNNNRVEVDMIQGFNLQKRAVYPELLSPMVENKNDGVKHPPVLKMHWKMLNPVGGIPIMQQAKLLIQPLSIQMDYDTSKMLFEYLFPKSEDEKHHSVPVPEEELKRDTSSDISSFDRSMEVLPEKPKNIFKNFMNKGSQSLSATDDEDSISPSSSRHPDSISTRFSSSEDLSTPEGSKPLKPAKECNLLPGNLKKAKSKEEGDDISLIVSRSSKFISIVDIEVEKVKLLISFKAPKHLNIIDVHNLSLNIPNLRYLNKTWSGEDFILRLRKDIIKIILQHTGHILGNKFKIRRRKLLKEPLKQISNYASFVSVQDLQNTEGETNESTVHRERLNGHRHHQHHHRRRLDGRNGDSELLHPGRNTSFLNVLQEIADEEEEEDTDSVV